MEISRKTMAYGVSRAFAAPAPVKPRQVSRPDTFGETPLQVVSPRAFLLDSSKDAVTHKEFVSRLGEEAGQAIWGLALKGGSTDDVHRLTSGKATLHEVYRWAAFGIFGGKAAGRKATYVELMQACHKAGLAGHFDQMMAQLPRSALKALMAGTLTPQEVFSANAQAVSSFRESRLPIDIETWKRLVTAEGRGEEIAKLQEEITPAERTMLAEGVLSASDLEGILERHRAKNADVIIIGAGMAGLSAANELIDAGKSIVILEARPRTGGRTETESHSMGFSIDAGAQYLHNPDVNPLTPEVKARGFHTVPADGEATFWYDGEKLVNGDEGLNQAWEERYHALMHSVKTAAASGKDVPITEVFPAETKLQRMTLNDLGSLTTGVNAHELSTKFLADKVSESHGLDDSTLDQVLKEGMGTFIQSFAHGLPVKLGTVVEQVSWSDSGVQIRANGQTYKAKTAIVTVPTGVLQANRIEFNPPLPPEKVEALNNLPMGHFKKIFLEYAPGTFPKEASHCAVYDLDESRAAYLVGVGGKDGLVFAMCGGDLSTELEAKGEDATKEYFRQQLKKIFGAKVDKGFRQGFVSKWEKDEFSLGAYAVARPGHSDAREKAREMMGPVAFAGEAYDMKWPTYLPGALETGKLAAREVLAKMEELEARPEKSVSDG